MQSVSSNAVANAIGWTLYSQSQATTDFGFQLSSAYNGTVSIGNYVKTSNLLILLININNISGGNIGTSSTAVIGTCNIRPKSATSDYAVTTTAIDYTKTSTQIRLGIFSDGRVGILESMGVTSGSNAIRACFVIPI